MTRLHRLAAALIGALAFALSPAAALSAEYPTKPITMIVPFPAGGVVDVIGRLVADRIGKSLGQPVVVENRVGAGGTIGAAQVANAQPDGYTLLMGGAATNVFGPAMYRKLPYDPVRSFEPITHISAEPLVLVVNPALPVKSYKELEDYLRAKGEAVNYASNGPGTFPHLAVELLKQARGLKATHVPYAGGPKALLALLSNEVTFSINHIPNILSQVRAGKLKALAMTGSARSPLFPDVPTFAELGVPGVEASAWWGLFAPAGTPKPIIDKLNAVTVAALKTPELRAKLLDIGDETVGSSPAELAAYLRSELDKWPPIIKAAGVKVD